MSGYSCRNICVFSFHRNTSKDGADVRSSGPLEPAGTTSSKWSTSSEEVYDRRRDVMGRQSTTRHSRSDKYRGVVPLPFISFMQKLLTIPMDSSRPISNQKDTVRRKKYVWRWSFPWSAESSPYFPPIWRNDFERSSHCVLPAMDIRARFEVDTTAC